MKLKIEITLLISLVILLIASCGPPPTPEPTPTPTVHPGKAVVASRCIGCHELSRVSNAAYDQEGWQLTVDRMVLSGAQLSDEQVALVVEYLAEAYPKE
jgi:mono/diheme cytochrome c family protein